MFVPGFAWQGEGNSGPFGPPHHSQEKAEKFISLNITIFRSFYFPAKDQILFLNETHLCGYTPGIFIYASIDGHVVWLPVLVMVSSTYHMVNMSV